MVLKILPSTVALATGNGSEKNKYDATSRGQELQKWIGVHDFVQIMVANTPAFLDVGLSIKKMDKATFILKITAALRTLANG